MAKLYIGRLELWQSLLLTGATSLHISQQDSKNMKFIDTAILLSLAGSAVAYPFMGTPGAPRHYQEWSNEHEKRQLGFNADAQRIEVTGDHAFIPPGAGDLRGPCPGLNALSNHGYLPRDGKRLWLPWSGGLLADERASSISSRLHRS